MLTRLKYLFKEKFLRQSDASGISLKYAEINSSTVMLNKNSMRFDVAPENRKYVQIGERCLIHANFIFESAKGRVQIGNNVHIGNASFISRSEIIVGDDVTMAWGITIYDHDSHSIYWEERRNDNNQCYEDYQNYKNNVVNKDWANVKSLPIKICSKVWIGFDVTILKGVMIGEGAVIGAKSVITKNVEPWTVVAGNPAKIVKRLR